MTVRLSQVKIGGVDVSNYVSEWSIKTSYGDELSYCEIDCINSISDVVTITTASTLEIYEGYTSSTDIKIFSGFVETHVPKGFKIVVIGRDELADLVRKEVTHVYDKTVGGDAANPDGKLSDIALDIITTYGGLTADGTTVQDSGTDITLSKFICNHADPLERLKKLAETLGWVLYYRADTDKVYFEPREFTTNATTLTVGTNIIGIPKWQYSKDQMINDLTLEGAIMTQPREETFDGNASDTTFTLTTAEAPTKIDVYLSATKDYSSSSVAEAEHQIGVPAGTVVGTFDYTFDLKQKSFTFTSTTPPTNTGNILSRAFIETPNPIHRVDGASITANGRYQKTIPLTDVLNVDDAEKRSEKIIEKYSQPFKSAKLTVNVTDSTFRVGQGVTVVDAVNQPNVSEVLTITKIEKNWPGNFDTFWVGDQEWFPAEWEVNITERLKRLEETNIGDLATVNEIIDQSISFQPAPHSQQILVEYINDSFILGNPPNDILYDSDEAFILDDFTE